VKHGEQNRCRESGCKAWLSLCTRTATTDPLNYRGITLLSIVGKVYTRVLSDRVAQFAERSGGVVEEQGGFRPGRGTEDQLFALTEILHSRGHVTTYAAFIDVKKAYDTVWRDGMWKRLWDEGVRGRVWRVIKNMYSVVQSAVLVGKNRRSGLI
jgi:hypothetical protein